ncbi:MAG: hypothetical protein JWP02_2216 [Acidimicrobiales bacterium]|nr:hypothetical protein [Acidimicrobiales bacterium]
MDGIGSVYAAGRARIAELVTSVEPEQEKAPVPACPEWSVHDVLAHLTGVCADVLAGNIDGVTTDPWTAAQVERRRDVPLDEVVKEWSETAPQVEAMAEHFPGRAGEQWVFDLTTHEQDIRGALSRPGARDSDGIAVGLDFLVTMGMGSSIAGRGLPPLLVKADGREWVIGGDDADATNELEAEPFELFRAMAGRRSRSQISAYAWTCDPDVYVPAFTYGPFTIRSTDLVE